jgi:hypothetical protein
MLKVQFSKKVLSNIRGTRDLNFWATATVEPWLAPKAGRPDIQKTVQKYKTRFEGAWEELAKR